MKNGQIKRMISRRMLILSYTIPQVNPNVCTNFLNPRSYSSWEIFDKNFKFPYVLHLSDRWTKEKMEKEGTINQVSIFSFTQQT